jgi:hypothetical protein
MHPLKLLLGDRLQEWIHSPPRFRLRAFCRLVASSHGSVLSKCCLSDVCYNRELWTNDARETWHETCIWEIDIGLSESAIKYDIWLSWRVRVKGHFKVTKVKTVRIVLTVALGPGCVFTKIFTIAQLIKVYIDIWPWLTFRGHLKVTNVKIYNINREDWFGVMRYIINIFLTVRDKHVVTMKHYWELLSDFQNPQKSWPWATLNVSFECHEGNKKLSTRWDKGKRCCSKLADEPHSWGQIRLENPDLLLLLLLCHIYNAHNVKAT